MSFTSDNHIHFRRLSVSHEQTQFFGKNLAQYLKTLSFTYLCIGLNSEERGAGKTTFADSLAKEMTGTISPKVEAESEYKDRVSWAFWCNSNMGVRRIDMGFQDVFFGRAIPIPNLKSQTCDIIEHPRTETLGDLDFIISIQIAENSENQRIFDYYLPKKKYLKL